MIRLVSSIQYRQGNTSTIQMSNSMLPHISSVHTRKIQNHQSNPVHSQEGYRALSQQEKTNSAFLIKEYPGAIRESSPNSSVSASCSNASTNKQIIKSQKHPALHSRHMENKQPQRHQHHRGTHSPQRTSRHSARCKSPLTITRHELRRL
jgi:hypothetical protein